MAMTQNEQKELVASTAIDTLIKDKKIFSGMKIGLGTGSTAIPAVKHLAKRINDGTLKDIKAVVTSFGTQNLCEELGIPVYSMNDKIIEIGAVKMKDGAVIETFDELINPGVQIDSEITNLTGITNNMVKDCPNEEEVTLTATIYYGCFSVYDICFLE